jgi:hypothetical protein
MQNRSIKPLAGGDSPPLFLGGPTCCNRGMDAGPTRRARVDSPIYSGMVARIEEKLARLAMLGML